MLKFLVTRVGLHNNGDFIALSRKLWLSSLFIIIDDVNQPTSGKLLLHEVDLDDCVNKCYALGQRQRAQNGFKRRQFQGQPNSRSAGYFEKGSHMGKSDAGTIVQKHPDLLRNRSNTIAGANRNFVSKYNAYQNNRPNRTVVGFGYLA